MSDDSNPLIKALLQQSELFGDELYLPLQNLVKRGPGKMAESKELLPPVSENKTEYEVKKKEVIERKTEIKINSIEFRSAENLEDLYSKIHECQQCILGKSRNKFVYGVGNPQADVMLVGEGPGAEEDLCGEPFVGRAGQLLTDILKAIKFSREEVYIANIVKCRPPGNRTPAPDEMDACFPYLEKQIELIKPKLILCLGTTAAFGILKKKEALGKMRQQVFEYNNIKVMVTYHPAALLRNPNWKRDCWEDVKAFKTLYENVTGKVKE